MMRRGYCLLFVAASVLALLRAGASQTGTQDGLRDCFSSSTNSRIASWSVFPHRMHRTSKSSSSGHTSISSYGQSWSPPKHGSGSLTISSGMSFLRHEIRLGYPSATSFALPPGAFPANSDNFIAVDISPEYNIRVSAEHSPDEISQHSTTLAQPAARAERSEHARRQQTKEKRLV